VSYYGWDPACEDGPDVLAEREAIAGELTGSEICEAAAWNLPETPQLTVAKVIEILQHMPLDALCWSEGCDCEGETRSIELVQPHGEVPGNNFMRSLEPRGRPYVLFCR
jgi:hypothetical protein